MSLTPVHFLPPGIEPHHLDAAIRGIVDMIPAIQRGKAIGLEGIDEIERAIGETYDKLMARKQHYIPNPNDTSGV